MYTIQKKCSESRLAAAATHEFQDLRCKFSSEYSVNQSLIVQASKPTQPATLPQESDLSLVDPLEGLEDPHSLHKLSFFSRSKFARQNLRKTCALSAMGLDQWFVLDLFIVDLHHGPHDTSSAAHDPIDLPLQPEKTS